MILNKFMRFIIRVKTRYDYFLHSLSIFRFLGNILDVFQYRLLHKTQLNSRRTKETLVYAPHKAVEKA